jgi:hypothetical protein
MGNCCLTGSSRRKAEYGAIAKSPQKLRDRQESQLLLEHDMGEKQSREAPPLSKQQPVKQSRSISSSSDSSDSDGDSDDDRGHSQLKQSSFSIPHLKSDVDSNAKIGGVDNPAAELITEKIHGSHYGSFSFFISDVLSNTHDILGMWYFFIFFKMQPKAQKNIQCFFCGAAPATHFCKAGLILANPQSCATCCFYECGRGSTIFIVHPPVFSDWSESSLLLLLSPLLSSVGQAKSVA